uniref:Reverse transcriptase Ty1/copia-type domain-containing protein n=1 Tax=Ananas comosus var. bracteatus TaxID=296719 RepID=A0A6V7Q3G1_ANACO|nr:unnamed protein product [Ananas comosus var. bracteatus]
MPSSVLDGDIPYTVLFPSKSLFSIEPRLFGSTCFVRDVRPQSGEEDDLLVYTIRQVSSPAIPIPAPSAPVQPPIVHVYSRRLATPDSDPPPASSSENLVTTFTDLASDSDLPIALRKGKLSVPKSVVEALSHSGWRAAMEEEMMALDANARLKARLVAKGYAQTYGVDYSDTFSPVAKLVFIRLFISLATTSHWVLHQLDIKNVFSMVIFKKRFSEVVQEFGMKKSKCDHSVFYRHSETGIILLVVYVDDIVITGNDTARISSLKLFLQTQFQTKDLGMLKYFLGIEVTRCKRGIFLSQRKYVLDLLAETEKLGAKPCSAPMAPNLQLTANDDELFEDPERYRRLVGKLNYLTVTRPDIAYSVSMLSQFMSSPTVTHWKLWDKFCVI